MACREVRLMTTRALLQLYMLNAGISIAAAVWIYRDSKARAIISYRYQPWLILLAGLLGLWFPYILYYLLFRTHGKLIRCSKDKHWVSEVLPRCPSCNPSMLMSQRQLEKHLESWRVTKRIDELLDKLPSASAEVKGRETRLWFERLAHYQRSYLYYLSVNGLMLLLLSVFLSLIIFSPLLKLEIVPFLVTLILLGLFSFSSISTYQILRRIQSEIEMVKIISTTLVEERGEFFRTKSQDIFSSISAWGMQVSSALLTTTSVLLVLDHFEPYNQFVDRLAEKQPMILVFCQLLLAGILLAVYLGMVKEMKAKMDRQQTREMYGLLEKLAGKEVSGPASPKARPATVKAARLKTTKK